jgi:hypothetical protein
MRSSTSMRAEAPRCRQHPTPQHDTQLQMLTRRRAINGTTCCCTVRQQRTPTNCHTAATLASCVDSLLALAAMAAADPCHVPQAVQQPTPTCTGSSGTQLGTACTPAAAAAASAEWHAPAADAQATKKRCGWCSCVLLNPALLHNLPHAPVVLAPVTAAAQQIQMLLARACGILAARC